MSKKALKKHYATHHSGNIKERKFICPYENCEKKYAHAKLLRLHIEKRHKNSGASAASTTSGAADRSGMVSYCSNSFTVLCVCVWFKPKVAPTQPMALVAVMLWKYATSTRATALVVITTRKYVTSTRPMAPATMTMRKYVTSTRPMGPATMTMRKYVT